MAAREEQEGAEVEAEDLSRDGARKRLDALIRDRMQAHGWTSRSVGPREGRPSGPRARGGSEPRRGPG